MMYDMVKVPVKVGEKSSEKTRGIALQYSWLILGLLLGGSDLDPEVLDRLKVMR